MHGASTPGVEPHGTAVRTPKSDNLALLRRMLLLRAYDERAVALHCQGKIGAYPTFWGEEGVQAGAVSAVRDSDWLFPTYRQNGLAILRGLPPEQALRYFSGDPRSFFDPRVYACAPQCVPISTHLPHAVGWAWAQARAGRDDVAVAFFGDGATSEGDFHEGLNLAGVMNAPVVFVCTNNRWAISTPFEKQTAARSITEKAPAYGITGIEVDGFDARAVRDVVAIAAERARAGAGPTLIEAQTYRIAPHATADDPTRYRDQQEAEAWREREPIARLASELIEQDELSEAEFKRQRELAEQTILDAAERLALLPPLDRRPLIDQLYAALPGQLEAQLAGRTA